MANIDDDSGGRSSNVELNLVPFIDLMSVLITFLLITAVWSQVSMIQLGSSIEGKKSENQEPMDPPPDADVVLRVDARAEGFRVVMETDTQTIPKKGEDYDGPALMALLKRFKEKYPEKLDAKISVQETLAYEVLIISMDALLQSGFPQMTVIRGGIE